MIKRYSDHAANERTFLAWVRTAIAVMAFGFLIERFDLFLKYAVPQAVQQQAVPHGQTLANLAGLAFIAIGVTMIVIAGARFVRTAKDIEFGSRSAVARRALRSRACIPDRTPWRRALSLFVAGRAAGAVEACLNIGMAATAVCHFAAAGSSVTSSVTTLKPASVQGPNEVTIATSVASRPRAIRMRPMRGVLWRASNVYQRPPR